MGVKSFGKQYAFLSLNRNLCVIHNPPRLAAHRVNISMILYSNIFGTSKMYKTFSKFPNECAR